MEILKMIVIFGYICCWFSGVIVLAMGIGRFFNKHYKEPVTLFVVIAIVIVLFLCWVYFPLVDWVW